MKEYGKTVLMVTHDPVVAKLADLELHLEKGLLVEGQPGATERLRRRCRMKFSRLIFANLFRKKLRLILTIGSFAVALFLFSFLAVVKGAFGRGADVAGADRLVIINRISIIQPLPLSYRDKILRIPGVKAVTHNNWFGGVYQDEKNFFPQFVIDVENQRKVIPEFIVPDDQWANFVKDRQGAIVGAKTAERFGWKIGDRIPIKTTIFGGASTWEFNLDGIYHSTTVGGDESQFWFQWDAFEEGVPKTFKDNVGWYVVKLAARMVLIPGPSARNGRSRPAAFSGCRCSGTPPRRDASHRAGATR